MTGPIQAFRRHPLAVPITATVAVGAVWLAFETFTWISGFAKIGGFSGMAADGEVSVRVELPFEPEAFHLTYFQNAGRIARTDGREVYLRAIDPAGLRALAREYWIADVLPWADEGA